MEFQYRQDIGDYKIAQKYICRELTGKSLWRFVPVATGVVFGLCAMLGVMSIGKHYQKYSFLNHYELNWGLGAIALGVAVLIAGLSVYNRVITQQSFDPKGLFRDLHTVALTDSHLAISVRNNQYRYAYEDMLRVEENTGYVFIFIDDGAALYFPVKAIGGDEAKAAFIHEVQQRIARGKPQGNQP